MIKLAKYYCSLNDEEPKRIKEPQINVYVRLQNVCNADCDFCEFCGQAKKFDEEKFKALLIKLHTIIKINKLSFTGGEPTLDFPLFKRMLNFVNELDKDIFTVVNTNGLHLKELAELDINSVALSRHHYNDELNQSVFKTKVPTSEDIRLYNKKNTNLHLSCNLVKDYVDSQEEVLKYLDWCDSVNARDIGFVGLMKTNDFCKEHYIDYSVVTKNHKRIWNSKTYSRHEGKKLICRCGNYVFMGENGLVNFYCRHYMCNNNSESILVYDINEFKNGFAGENVDSWIASR